MSGLDWFPTLVAAAGNPDIAAELQEWKGDGGRTYEVHLDGYDQTELLTGRAVARDEIFYFTEGTLARSGIGDYKYRFTDQPNGWLGGTVKVDWPIVANLRLDPFERMGMPDGENGSLDYYGFFVHEFWRSSSCSRRSGRLAQTFVEFPPMQRGATFNVEAVKAQVEAAIENARVSRN